MNEANDAYQRALNCYQRTLGPSDPAVATILENLASLWRTMAEAADQRAAWIQTDNAETAKGEVQPGSIQSHFRLEIRRSRIHRFGVFAAEDIPSGCDIIEYTGERLSRRQVARFTDGVRTYLLQVDAYWSIDGSRGGSGAEYINHCCEPNLKGRRAEGRVWLIARRSIAAGEELTLDYRFHPDSPRVPCYCGAGNCRGTINRKTRAVRD